jgi:hypothetical protein
MQRLLAEQDLTNLSDEIRVLLHDLLQSRNPMNESVQSKGSICLTSANVHPV